MTHGSRRSRGHPGTFSAHWESADGRDHLDGPEGVSADEAIAWGRRHSEVVWIRLGDSDVHYSADEWPEGKTVEPRRLPGMEHLDFESPEPVPWEIRLPRRVSRRRAKAEMEQMRAALADDPAVSDLRASLERGKRPHPEAMHAVLDLQRRTLPRWVRAVDPWDPVENIRPRLG